MQHVTDFIAKAKPLALEVQKKFGVPYGVVVSASALESGWGRHVKGNSYFGIKGKGQEFETHEIIDGKRVDIVDSFRAYDSMEESFADYGRFLTSNGRYAACFLYKDDPEAFARELQRAGYATDPEYANKLISIMRRHKLLEPMLEEPKPKQQGGNHMFAKIQQAFQAVAVMRVLIGIVDPIKDLVQVAEDLFSGAIKMGPEKKAFVLEALESALKTTEKAIRIELPASAILEFAETLIDLFVRLFNLIGTFRQGGTEPEKK